MIYAGFHVFLFRVIHTNRSIYHGVFFFEQKVCEKTVNLVVELLKTIQ